MLLSSSFHQIKWDLVRLNFSTTKLICSKKKLISYDHRARGYVGIPSTNTWKEIKMRLVPLNGNSHPAHFLSNQHTYVTNIVLL